MSSSYVSPRSSKKDKYRNDLTRDGSPYFSTSRVRTPKNKIYELKNNFDQIIKQVENKAYNSMKAVNQVQECNKDLLSFLTQNQQQQQLSYIERLERQNIELKRRLNEEIRNNNQLIKKVNQLEDQKLQNKKYGSGRNLDLQNKALKSRLLKMHEQYNKLYYQLEILKNNGDKLRKQTINLIVSRVE